MRRFAGGRNVMLATGEGSDAPAAGMRWVFSTALSRAELDSIHPALDRGLSHPPRLVYAGRLSSEKGVAVLIEALAMLKREGFQPLPSVTLVGDGPERRTLERLALELGCADSIQFAGHCNRSDLSRHLMTADLCVQPSLSEGLQQGLARCDGTRAAGRGVERRRGRRRDWQRWRKPAWLAGAARRARTRWPARSARRILTPLEWPELRRRCRAYVEARTLEAWAHEIGQACAQQWSASMVGGKLSA